MKQLLKEFGRCIFLEEDIVVAKNFLCFMNQGLNHFIHDEKVFAICAYTPPVEIPIPPESNSFRCARFSAWGFGIWADRFSQIETERISESQLNHRQRRRLWSAGTDLVQMVGQMERQEIEALDVRINFTMAKLNKQVVCPTKSQTNNRGHDGTGIHCGVTDHFETRLDEREDIDWQFQQAKCNWRIDKALYFYRGHHQRTKRNSALYHLTRKVKSSQ